MRTLHREADSPRLHGTTSPKQDCSATSRCCWTAGALQHGPPEQVFQAGLAVHRRVPGAENVFAGTAPCSPRPHPIGRGRSVPLAHGYHAIEFTSGPLTSHGGERGPWSVLRGDQVGRGHAVTTLQSTSARNEPPRRGGRYVRRICPGDSGRGRCSARRRSYDTLGSGDGTKRRHNGVRDIQGHGCASLLSSVSLACPRAIRRLHGTSRGFRESETAIRANQTIFHDCHGLWTWNEAERSAVIRSGFREPRLKL